jgi:hypothetical protein
VVGTSRRSDASGGLVTEPTKDAGAVSDTKSLGAVVQIDDGKIRAHLDEMVRSTVEETLNALLAAEVSKSPICALYFKPIALDLCDVNMSIFAIYPRNKKISIVRTENGCMVTSFKIPTLITKGDTVVD